MTEIFHCDTTYEREDALGNVTCSVEVRIEFTYTPAVSARIHWDENDHPAEGPEIEISGIREESWVSGLGKQAKYEWVKMGNLDLYGLISDWAQIDLFDLLVESAQETMVGREEAAAEHAYESRRALADINAAEDRLARNGDE